MRYYIFPYEIVQENLLARKVYYRIYYRISFLLSHMFPWMNKFLITENMFLPRSVIGTLQLIFQSLYALNTRSTKVLRRNVIKALITLLIKQ